MLNNNSEKSKYVSFLLIIGKVRKVNFERTTTGEMGEWLKPQVC